MPQNTRTHTHTRPHARTHTHPHTHTHTHTYARTHPPPLHPTPNTNKHTSTHPPPPSSPTPFTFKTSFQRRRVSLAYTFKLCAQPAGCTKCGCQRNPVASCSTRQVAKIENHWTAVHGNSSQSEKTIGSPLCSRDK